VTLRVALEECCVYQDGRSSVDARGPFCPSCTRVEHELGARALLPLTETVVGLVHALPLGHVVAAVKSGRVEAARAGQHSCTIQTSRCDTARSWAEGQLTHPAIVKDD
jgi:hypothetical protein